MNKQQNDQIKNCNFTDENNYNQTIITEMFNTAKFNRKSYKKYIFIRNILCNKRWTLVRKK